ncbi:tyrosine-type recombinase/integrase [Halobacillus sp. Cin3]|uniref:tyrosine-type recombinase/integrase n=1 Tax=Halobacillus sp. Cin3 TaxID=2928441 RepID=UPI00248F2AA9|nr:tyrosine-type recombinase/integrase [Halobacillus sp. Cin3]
MNNFEFHLDNFMLYCDSKGLSRKTLTSYEQTLRLFTYYVQQEHGLTEVKYVKSAHIRMYIKYLRERGKYTVVSNQRSLNVNFPDRRTDNGKEISDTTISNYVRNIKVFFNFLYAEREIQINPVDKLENVKPQRKKKPLLKREELKKMLNTMDTSIFHEYRLWVQTRLILDTGLRAGECCNLMPDEVDFKYKSILVKNTKSGHERYVYFSHKLSNELKRWLKYRDRFSDSEYMFPTIRGTRQDIRNFRRSLKEAGKRVGVEVHPHQLRNNFAKFYLLNGGDWVSLSRILGHSSAEVTQKHYLDFTDDEIRIKYNKHSPLNTLDI